MRCENCRFWRPDADWRGTGECRRHAPSIPISRKAVGGSTRHGRAMFPYTADYDWCGEHEPREKKS